MKNQTAKFKKFVKSNKELIAAGALTVFAAGVLVVLNNQINDIKEGVDLNREVWEDPRVNEAFEEMNLAAQKLDITIDMVKHELDNQL